MASCDQEIEEKRRRNREYMRRWRADPRNRDHERASRQRWHYERKLRAARRDERPVCGLCHKRRPVCQVQRLLLVEDHPGGFVEVRVPYCGQC